MIRLGSSKFGARAKKLPVTAGPVFARTAVRESITPSLVGRSAPRGGLLAAGPVGFFVYFRPNFLRAKERHRSTGISVETFDNPHLLVWEPLLGKPDVCSRLSL